jgi:cytoskeletal protein CcmA (bactofilin family)
LTTARAGVDTLGVNLHARLTRICLAVTTLLALLVPATGARSAEPQVGQTVVQSGPAVASDLYAFGGGVDIHADVQGDLVAAGSRVVTAGRVQGNLIVAAGSVVIGGTVVRNVRGAGGAVTISGHVGGNLNAGGGTVVLTPEALIDGRARLVGGEVHVAGTVANKLYAAGAVIVLAGEFQDDVELVAQEIEVLPTTRIKGGLTYWSPRDARIDGKAKIQGGVTHNLPELPRALTRTGTALVTVSRLLFMAALIVTGVALYLLFPVFTVLASHTIGSDPVKSLGIGLLLVAAMPVIAILTMLTILGIPLGLILFVLYFAALLVGFLITAFFLSDVGARAFIRPGRRSRAVRVVWLILALGVLALVNQVPVLGGVLMAAVLVGSGAMSLYVWRHLGDHDTPRAAG